MNVLRSVAVIGAGTMGRGIAQVSALAGFATRLFDVDVQILEEGMNQIDQQMAEGVARDKITEDDRTLALAHLSAVDDLSEA
ncbi:uncharacterized protein METZ01_LOCUS295607, partial [marine metagenome]